MRGRSLRIILYGNKADLLAIRVVVRFRVKTGMTAAGRCY